MPPGYTHTVFGFGSFLDWRPTSFASAIPATLVCSACVLVPATSALLPCRHGLCASCFERCVDGECGGQCPIEKQGFQSEDVIWSAFEKDALLNRKIHCWNADRGCDAVAAASEILQHFNHHCQHHVVPCPSCGKEVVHNDVISHLDCGSCVAAAEESTKAQDRHSNVSVVPVECIQTFENTLKENSEMIRIVSAKISEVRESEECNASVIQQFQHEIKNLLRELQEKQAQISEERTEMSAALVSIKAKVDALADEQVAGNGNVGNRLQKLEALIVECKTVGTKNAQALEDMKVDFNEKLNNLGDASKAIFLDLRRESEPLEWTIPDWSKVKEEARRHSCEFCEAENPNYFGGYYVLPGLFITSSVHTLRLGLTLRVCKGAYDHLLPWPMRETFCLRVVHSTGQCFEGYIELDTREHIILEFQRPIYPQNGQVLSFSTIEVREIEEAGCINDDTLRVRLERKS